MPGDRFLGADTGMATACSVFRDVVVNAVRGRHFPGKKRSARGRADRAGRKGAIHPCSGLGGVVHSRGMNFPIAVAMRGPLTVIISEKDKDIWFAFHRFVSAFCSTAVLGYGASFDHVK